MMGSGTVLALARSKGHRAIGFDIDPLAVLISKVWVTAIDKRKARDAATKALHRARHIFASLATRDAYPRRADDKTRKFVAYWFDDYSRRQLTALSIAIGRVQDATIRSVLWCGFSRLIISKQSGASLAMDLSHSRPHKAFERAPAKPFQNFQAAIDRVVENCIDKRSADRGPAPQIHEGDARYLPVSDASIDLVLTSPPYLNAIDYIRCSKFSLVWMGYSIAELRQLRAESIGAEAGRGAPRDNEDIRSIIAQLSLRPPLAANDQSILERYIDDILRSVREVARVLSPKGKAVYVVGENTIKGTFVRNSSIVSAVAQRCGLSLRKRHVRSLPANRRYLPPPSTYDSSDAMDTRMRREVVLAFNKPAKCGPIPQSLAR
jgi:DNA modification methylase